MANERTNDSISRNNDEQPDAGVLPARSKFWRNLCAVGMIFAISIVVIALFLPAPRSAPEAGKRMTCQKNIREVGLGSHIFNSADIDFGSAQTIVESGAPNRKWRKLISFTTSNELDDPYRRMKKAKPRPSPEF